MKKTAAYLTALIIVIGLCFPSKAFAASAGGKNTAAGNDGVWTIFVYMCGSDLETYSAAASMDLMEMMNSSLGRNARFIVETGGARDWYNNVSRNHIERYEITRRGGYRVDSLRQSNMGESGTLADFINWGLENYSSEHMGLVFWDHGSGSINGACFDEIYSYDGLDLMEIKNGLERSIGRTGWKFDFIGFDACLMATVETAAVLQGYADYMVASEETETGYGWDYTAIGAYLGYYPDTSAARLGKVICDSFYESCDLIGAAGSSTMSVTDLNKTQALINAFDAYAQDIYELTGNSDTLSAIIKQARAADNYGGNNVSEGFANMVDLGGIINAGAKYSDKAAAAQRALEEAVVYQIKGSDHQRATGLSIYYPLQTQGSSELNTFKEVCISNYYLGLVDKIVYGLADPLNTAGYNNQGVVEGHDGDWDYLDGIDLSESAAITFDDKPQVSESGTLWFDLSDEGLKNTASVQSIVYLLSGDGEIAICLGLSSDVRGNWNNGVFADNFDGLWFALPDGQPLCIYLVEECDGYDIYTSPVEYNGEAKNLRFVWDYEAGEVYMIGVWDGIEDYGAAGRIGTELKRGDVIVPLYDAFEVESGKDTRYYGEPYVYYGDPYLDFAPLLEGQYIYGFCIDDIYGGSLFTDMVYFMYEDGTVYFDDEMI